MDESVPGIRDAGQEAGPDGVLCSPAASRKKQTKGELERIGLTGESAVITGERGKGGEAYTCRSPAASEARTSRNC